MLHPSFKRFDLFLLSLQWQVTPVARNRRPLVQKQGSRPGRLIPIEAGSRRRARRRPDADIPGVLHNDVPLGIGSRCEL
jgi:hypothetical protein